jgi:hypothetical protein
MHPPYELSLRLCCWIVLQIPRQRDSGSRYALMAALAGGLQHSRSRRRSARPQPNRRLGARASFSARCNFHQAPPSCSIDLAHCGFRTILSTVRAPLIDTVQQRGQLQAPHASLSPCAGPSAASSVFFAALKCRLHALFNYPGAAGAALQVSRSPLCLLWPYALP